MRRNLFHNFLPFALFVHFLSLSAAASTNTPAYELIERAVALSEKIDAKTILDMLCSGIISSFESFSSSFGICFCLLTVGIIFSALKDSFNENSEIFDLISRCAIIIAVSSALTVCITKASEHIEALCALMLSFVPAMIMLYSASGSSFTAAAASASLPFTVSAIQTVSCGIVLPLIKGACCLSMVNSLCKRTNLSGMISVIKSICLWIIGLCFTLFTGVLSLQSQLQSGADTLVIKGLRFGAAKMIPIAGGMVSESMKNVITSVSLIKGVTGISGILLVLYTVLPPITVCLTAKLCFYLLSAYAKSTCQEGIGTYLDAVCGILNIILSLIIGCAVSFMIVFGIFLKTNVSI